MVIYQRQKGFASRHFGNTVISLLSLFLSVGVEQSFAGLDDAEIWMNYMAEMAQRTRLIAAAGSSGHAVVCCL
jgi:hypothetical protein